MKLLTGPVLAAFLVCGPSPQNTGIAGIVLVPEMLCIDVDEEQQVTANAFGFDGMAIANPMVTWTIADTSIATVTQDGKVKGVAVGSTKLTASAGSAMSNEVTVTVPKACSVTVKERWRVRGKHTQTVTTQNTSGTSVTEGDALVEGERFSNHNMLVMTVKGESGSATHVRNTTLGDCTERAELSGPVLPPMDCAIFFLPQEGDAFNVATYGECTTSMMGTNTRTCPLNQGGTTSFMTTERLAWLFMPQMPKFLKTVTSLTFQDTYTTTTGTAPNVTVDTWEWSGTKQP